MTISDVVFIGVCVMLAPHTSKSYAHWFSFSLITFHIVTEYLK